MESPEMATKEAVAQLAALPERVAIVETKVHQIEEKIDDLKSDVRDMHDCLDNTRDLLDKKLCEMSDESTRQHDELASKIKDLQTTKDRWVKYALAAMAFSAGAGWLNTMNLPHIIKFLGL
jgi:predicted  nucleic acid-binding Zn-ribbon protein